MQPFFTPSSPPSLYPSYKPSKQPYGVPSKYPKNLPSQSPTRQPTAQPLQSPSSQPLQHPTTQPTLQPFTKPSINPSDQPTVNPSLYKQNIKYYEELFPSGGWRQSQLPNNSFVNIVGVSCASFLNCFACGQQGIVAQHSSIFQSKNMGLSWNVIFKVASVFNVLTGRITQGEFTDITVNSATLTILTCAKSGQIYFSANNGASWITAVSIPAYLYGITIGSNNVAFTTGQSNTTKSGVVYSSSKEDFSVWVLRIAVQSSAPSQLNGVFTLDGLFAVAVGKNGLILQSKNGGLSWITVTTSLCNKVDLYSVSYSSDYTVYAGGDRGCLIKFGINSSLVLVQNRTLFQSLSIKFHAISAVSSQLVYITGVNSGADSPGLILKSRNGGQKWEIEYSAPSTYFNSIYMLDYQVGIAGAVTDIYGRNNIYVRTPTRTTVPTGKPSLGPSISPTCQPSKQPSRNPSRQPISKPSRQPQSQPTYQPQTSIPTSQPTGTLGIGDWLEITNIALIEEPISAHFRSGAWISSSLGILVGGSTNAAVGGIILNSMDGGKTWKVSFLNPAVLYQDVDFVTINNSKTFAVAIDTSGNVSVSTDGGDTWPVVSHVSSKTLYSIAMSESNGVGWVVGVGGIYRSSFQSAFSIWKAMTIKWSALFTSQINLYSVAVINSTNFVVSGDSLFVAICQDYVSFVACSQISFAKIDAPSTSTLFGLSCGGHSSILVTTNAGRILRSKNGGYDWYALSGISSAPTFPWTIAGGAGFGKVLHMITEAIAYLVDSKGDIHTTKNGGNSWTIESTIAERRKLPLFIRMYSRGSLGIIGGSVGNIFLKSPSPTAYPSSRPTHRPNHRPTVQPFCHPSAQPIHCPSFQPHLHPSVQPLDHPSMRPSYCPSGQPSYEPIHRPSSQPIDKPSRQPIAKPTKRPSFVPTKQPTFGPTHQKSLNPSKQPNMIPTCQPIKVPTLLPSKQPSLRPRMHPSHQPFSMPTSIPSEQSKSSPSVNPSAQPFLYPSGQPTYEPNHLPSVQPMNTPTQQPIRHPYSKPSRQPFSIPSTEPSKQPMLFPSTQPQRIPTLKPSHCPISFPSTIPTEFPSRKPTKEPTKNPYTMPTHQPVKSPSHGPHSRPTMQPSKRPFHQPSRQPNISPSLQPNRKPSREPFCRPTGYPSNFPSGQPTLQPSHKPSYIPSSQPIHRPSNQPKQIPTFQPIIIHPSRIPSDTPSSQPYQSPFCSPTVQPYDKPSAQPISLPSTLPSTAPTTRPDRFPSLYPSCSPSQQPRRSPSYQPNSYPTYNPSYGPMLQPSKQPSAQPHTNPSSQPSLHPTDKPAQNPSFQPLRKPTLNPSPQPVKFPSNQPINFPSKQPFMYPSHIPTEAPSYSPTVQPFQKPSMDPSKQPYRRPSGQPSRQPYRKPSKFPSRTPTYQPLKSPSCKPTFHPSKQPVRKPSSQPRIAPTRKPTHQPTNQPSSQPKVLPSTTPSKQPLRFPSYQPSSCPSLDPYSIPSLKPSSSPSQFPSMLPTLLPSSWPSLLPSLQPTFQPSRHPSVQPTDKPSSHPSAHPTTRPTGYPIQAGVIKTPRPSKAPTHTPTISPTTTFTRWVELYDSIGKSLKLLNTSSLFYQELTINGVLYAGECPQFQSFISGDLVSSNILQTPVSIRLETVTNIYTSVIYSAICSTPTAVNGIISSLANPSTSGSKIYCNGNYWNAKLCGGASFLCVNCSDPCSSFGCSQANPFYLGPCGSSYGSCSSMDSSTRTLRIDYRNRFSVPSILDLQLNVSSTSLGVTIKLSSTGFVYCAVYAGNEKPLKVSSIFYQNNYALFDLNSVDIQILDLYPGSVYSLYCATKNFYGNEMEYTDVLRSAITFETLCCKIVSVSLQARYVVVGSSVADAVIVKIDKGPLYPIHLILSTYTIGGSVYTHRLEPALIVIRDIGTYSASLTRANTMYPGRLIINATLVNAYDYNVRFVNGISSFEVVGSSQYISPPVALMAEFSSDGYSIFITFDSPTDTANFQSSIFACSQLLLFTTVQNHKCQWNNPSQLTIMLAPFSELFSGDIIQIFGYRIKSMSADDSRFNYTGATNLTLTYPANVHAPIGVVKISSVINICNSFDVDISYSTGAGNRKWKNVTFLVATPSVNSTSKAYELQELLKNPFDYYRPMTVPSNFLSVGFYNVIVYICNFMEACGIGFSSFEVKNDVIPLVIIEGSSSKYIKRRDALMITSSVLTQSCSAISADSYTLVWDIRQADISQPFIQSISTNPYVFLLHPYTLSVNTVYMVTLSVFSNANPSIISQSSISVNVAQSSIVAIIEGCGREGTLSAGQTLVLNASSSYDDDLPYKGNASLTYASDFLYKWSCITLFPSANSTCAIAIESESKFSPLLNVYAGEHSIDHVVRIVLQVISGNRTASTSVEFQIISSRKNFIKINSPPQITSLISDKVKVDGFIKSALDGYSSWSVNDSTVPLESILLSPINQFLQPSAFGPDFVIPISLVLSANALSPNSFYLFSLIYSEIGGIKMSASVIVKTISIPRSGGFSIRPLHGIEMTDRFQFTALFWLDDNLPLQYVFSFLHSNSYQALNLPFEKNSDEYLLPSGFDSLNMSLPCSVSVINSLGANNSAFQSVQVFRNDKLQNSSYINNLITASLNNAVMSGDSNALQYVFATSGAMLDFIVCSAVPNCSSLNRYACSEISNTCGNCFQGFTGELGNRNTKCYNATVYHTQTVSSGVLLIYDNEMASLGTRKLSPSCTTSSDCGIFEICDAISAKCVQQSKQCLNNCNGRGECTYQNTYSGAQLSSCFVSDTSCTAKCRCINSFGSFCTYPSTDELVTVKNTRLELISALYNSTKTTSITQSILSVQLNTLKSLTAVPDELSENAVLIANSVLLFIVNSAKRIKLSYEDMLPVPALVNNLIQAMVISYSDNLNSVTGIIDTEYIIMGIFTEIAFFDMRYGQNMYQLVLENIRYSIAALSSYSINNNAHQLSTPPTSIESSIGSLQNTATVINVDSGTTLAMGAVEFELDGFPFDSISISSPLLIQLDTICSDGCRLSLELNNRGVQTYSSRNSTSQQFKAKCTFGVAYKRTYMCNSGSTVHVLCNGSFSGTETVICPRNLTQPECNVVDEQSSKHSICATTTYSGGNTTCACDLSTFAVETNNVMSVSVSSQKVVKYINGSKYYSPSKDGTSSKSSQSLIDSFYSYRYVLGSVGILVVGLSIFGCYGIFYFCAFKVVDVSDLQNNLRQLMKENLAHRTIAEVPDHLLLPKFTNLLKGPAVTFITNSQLNDTTNLIKRLQRENNLWDEFYDGVDKAAVINIPQLRSRLKRDPQYILSEKPNPVASVSAIRKSIHTTGDDAELRSQKSKSTDVRVDLDREGLSVSDIYPSFNEHMPTTSFNNEFYLRSVEKIPLVIQISMDADDSTLSSSNNGGIDRPLTFDEPMDFDLDEDVEHKEETVEREENMELQLSLSEVDDGMDLEWNGYDDNELPDDILNALTVFNISDNDEDIPYEVAHKDITQHINLPAETEVTAIFVKGKSDEIDNLRKPLKTDATNDFQDEKFQSHVNEQKVELPELLEPVPKRSVVLSPQVVRPQKDQNRSKGKPKVTLGEVPAQEPIGSKATSTGDVSYPWLPAGADVEQSQPTEFQEWMRLDFNPNAAQAEQPQTATSRYLKPTKSSNSKVIGVGTDTNTTLDNLLRATSSNYNDVTNTNTDTLISSAKKKPQKNVHKPPRSSVKSVN